MGNVVMKPTSTILIKLGVQANGPVQSFATETCYKHMDKYVPKRNGDLRTNVDIQPDYITYESNYAKPQYKGYTKGPVRHYTTPGTGPFWDRRMVSAEIGTVIKEIQNFMRKGK